jgi:hypothetical protein
MLLCGLFLQGITGVDPGIEAAFQGVNIGETVVKKYLRRPGAGRFFMSGTIGDDEAVVGQLTEALLQLAVVDTPGPRYLYIRSAPVVRVSRVNKENRFALVESFPDLGKADPFRCHSYPL